MHFIVPFWNLFPHMGWNKNFRELVKPVNLMNCFLGRIKAVISLNFNKIKLENYFLDGLIIWANKSPNTYIPN